MNDLINILHFVTKALQEHVLRYNELNAILPHNCIKLFKRIHINKTIIITYV